MPGVDTLYTPSLWRVFFTEGYDSYFPSPPSPSTFPFLFFFLIGICNTKPRLINSCSSCAALYPLSKHRCYNIPLFMPLLDLDLDLDDFGLFITALSTTSVTRLMSWVLAGDITTDREIPSLSVKILLCRLTQCI
jgi:hypothetical protein